MQGKTGNNAYFLSYISNGDGSRKCKVMIAHFSFPFSCLILVTCSPCFMPHLFSPFCLYVRCEYTPLLYLQPLIFGLTFFDCLHCITLTRTYSIISYGNIIFYLCPPFEEHSQGVKQGLGTLRFHVNEICRVHTPSCCRVCNL